MLIYLFFGLRKHLYDEDDVKRHQYDEAERPCDKYNYCGRGRSASYSEDSFTKKSLMKSWHPHTIDDNVDSDDEKHDKISRVAPQPYHHSERSRSEVDDMPSSSSWQSDERHRHGHRSFKMQNDRREQCDNSSWIHYPIYKEKDVERKTVKQDGERRHRKHHNLSKSSLEMNHSTDHKKKRREKDSSRSSRHSEQKAKSAHDDWSHERWQMTSRSDEDNQKDYHYYKRKRVY